MISRLPAPESILLNRIEWDFFVTLTHAPADRRYKDSVPSRRRQEQRFFSWVNAIVRMLKIHPNSMRWVRRLEKGGIGGRDHFHALVNFHKRQFVNKTTKATLAKQWSDCLGYGWANVRLCKTMGAQAYITKIQNEYETNRFESDRYRSVEFSKSALKALRRTSEQAAVHTGY